MAVFIRLLVLVLVTSNQAQRTGAQVVQAQSDTFNSDYTLTPAQTAAANLSSSLAADVAVALNYERSNQALPAPWSGPDPFYSLPSNFSPTLQPGLTLRVERVSNTSLYTLPANTALSRIIYTTQSINGTTQPASAYILWPFSPNLKPGTNQAQLVAFAHGFSGVMGPCAPSGLRNLWYHFQMPYALALAGYAVVAPDFAGLGVNETVSCSGKKAPVRHAAACAPALGADILFAVQAARQAFPSQLTEEFVVAGHSEGGNGAWGAAESLAQKPVPGYLGTVAVSPLTNLTAIAELAVAIGQGSQPFIVDLVWGLLDVFDDFAPSEVLSPIGVSRLDLLAELGGCNSVLDVLVNGDNNPSALFAKQWWLGSHINEYGRICSAGTKPIAGPMLVMQGTADFTAPELVTTGVVEETCAMFPESAQIEYVVVNGTTHVPTLYAAQKEWLDWIRDRFAGVSATARCTKSVAQPYWPIENYQAEVSWFMEWAAYKYETD